MSRNHSACSVTARDSHLRALANMLRLPTQVPCDWRFGQTGAGVVLAWALSACATPSPRQAALPAIDLPAVWSAGSGQSDRFAADRSELAVAAGASSSAPLAQWWSRFDDPVLTGLMERALQANTRIGTAQAAWRQARALRDVSAAGLLPSIGASASAQRNFSGSGLENDPGGSSTRNSFRTGLDANWGPDLFGVNRSALDSSEASAQASAASVGDVQVSVMAEVALTYISLRSAEVRLQIASDSLNSQLETLQLTQWRLQAGLVTSLEAEQARAAAEQTRAQQPALQIQIEQARNALAVLTGQPPHALSLAFPPMPAKAMQGVGASLASGASGAAASTARLAAVPRARDDLALSIPAETLRQRADVRAAEYRVTAALARVAQVDAARAPSFKLGGSIGLSALTLSSLTSGAPVATALLASVSLPLFDGGAALAQVRAQQAAWEEAQFTYRATVLTALKDVEDALVALRSNRGRLVHLQNAAEAAGHAALWARQRFESGLSDFQTVLQTQRTQLSTQEALAAAQADWGADHVRLYKALGGGWNPDAPSRETSSISPSTPAIP